MIIARYITKEILWTFFATSTVLLFIALSNRFALYLAKVSSGELPLDLVFRVVILHIPEFFSYLIPLSFFVALLFAYGRLYADSEMTVLMACGISWAYICKLTLLIAFIVMLLVGLLTLWWVPEVTKSRDKAISEGESIGMLQSMLPGRFQTDVGGGNHVFYLEEISKEGALKGIFIAERPELDPNNFHGWTVINANEALMKKDAVTNEFYLVLKEGYRYQGIPGTANYKVMKFGEYGRAINQPTETEPSDVLRLKETKNLLFSHKLEDIAELQWRLSLPLSVLILALLAIPLSRVRPRHGRFAKFLPAILVYIVYYNLFTVCKRWIAAGTLPSYLGVWWVHLIFLGLGMGLLIRESGWLTRHKRTRH